MMFTPILPTQPTQSTRSERKVPCCRSHYKVRHSLKEQSKKSLILPISDCHTIHIVLTQSGYKAVIIEPSGKRSELVCETPADVESDIIKYVIAMYQLLSLYKLHIKFVCENDMLLSMYKEKKMWSNLDPSENIYAPVVAETFKQIVLRDLEILNKLPRGMSYDSSSK